MGSDGKRKLRLRRKTNAELFQLYGDQLVLRHRSLEALKESQRVLRHFQEFLGEFPPSPELAASFLARFAERKPTTLYRYHSIVKTFMSWYGEPLDSKIRLPETLPDYIEQDDIDKLKEAMKSKKTHKKVIQRNLLLIEVALKAGLRAKELSSLMVNDIDLARNYLIVRKGKGMKDRIIDLTPTLHQMLETYLKGKSPEGRVFNLSPSTVSGIVRWAAKKAGVNIHTHSLRHHFGQALVDTGTDIETVRRLMGHKNLRTTQVYLGRTDKQRSEAIARLEETRVNDTVRDEERIVLAESDLGLRLRVREVALIGSAKGVYLALFRLTFVNSSATGKTIYHIGCGAPGKQDVSNPVREYIENTSKVRITFSQNEKMRVDLEKSELLLPPFDVPPYESRNFWMPLQIHQGQENSGAPAVQLVLRAEDISGEIIAEFDEIVELKTYTIP